ncbi:MAG TPA: hypothetical protein PLT05_04105 [bacterium]|nr:hypothetical protein [bacterium]
MALSGGFRVEDGMIHNPAGFLGALSNVTKSAEDFITGRIGSSFGESNFAMFGAGDSPAASMIAAGSGQLSKLFAENARSLIAQQQGPGLSYDPVAEFMKMQGPEAPNFSGAAPAHSAPPPPAQRGGSNSLNIDASAKPSETIDDAKFKDTIADNKGYGENNAGQLLTIIQNKAGGDVKKAKELLRSLPSSGGELWRRDFAEWYLTKILGKSAEEAKKVVEKRVYGKGAEVKLKRTSGGDKKDKKVTVAHAFEVTSGTSDVMAAGSVYHRLSDGKWMAEDSDTLKEFAPLQGAMGEVILTDNTETTLTLKSDYRDGVEKMDVGALIDHLNTAFGVETVKAKGGGDS